MGLAGRLVSRARTIEKALELNRLQSLVQSMATFAGGHRYAMLPCFQVGQHHQNALKQADVIGMQRVMVTITCAQLRVFGFGNIGGGMGQRLHQAHANHIRGVPVTGHDATHISNRILNTTGDDGR